LMKAPPNGMNNDRFAHESKVKILGTTKFQFDNYSALL